MATNPLTQRLDEIRRRFASNLVPKIEDTAAALPLLSGKGANAAEAIAATYRRFHEIAGTGRTLGFAKLGAAAVAAESLLLEPLRTGRSLTDQEVSMLREAFDALKGAAGVELQGIIDIKEQKS